jgi:hypothetical protein
MPGTVPRPHLPGLFSIELSEARTQVTLTSRQDAPGSVETTTPATADRLPIAVSFAIPRVGPKDLVSGERLMG